MSRRRPVLFVGAVAIASLVAAACASDGDSSPTASGQGAELYAQNCATCHGGDGGGGQGPALGDGAVAENLTDAETVTVIAEGRAAMPSFADKLSEAEIAEVATYVREDLGTTDGEAEEAATDRGALSGMPPEMEDDGNWATANGDYAASRAVEDSAITSETIDQLELAWSYEAPGGGTFGNFTTTPLVVGDSIYVGALTTEVHAIDRASGEAKFVVGEEVGIFGPTGVGIGWNRLFGTAADADGNGDVVVAYDADDGEELWSTDIGANGGIINMQPVAYDGLVFASTSGYGAGTRATIYALDAETGAIVWDFVVIEDPDLWGNPDLNSGGGVWYPGTIDPERGIAYFGTGNPYPFPGSEGFPNGSSRPGDNKWTDSILALDIETGELAWGHQAIAHDIFDRDSMLTGRVDTEIDGEDRALAISTGKLGTVTALDADSGDVVWTSEVGTHENDELTEIDGPTLVYPGSLGGVQTPLAVADDTIYLCVMNAPTLYDGPEETSFGFTVQLGTADSQMVAMDASTGEIDWQVDLPGDALGGATVAADLVFTSTFAGEILALDRTTGETVWSYEAPGGINGWPAVAADELYVPVGNADPPQLLAFRLGG